MIIINPINKFQVMALKWKCEERSPLYVRLEQLQIFSEAWDFLHFCDGNLIQLCFQGLAKLEMRNIHLARSVDVRRDYSIRRRPFEPSLTKYSFPNISSKQW